MGKRVGYRHAIKKEGAMACQRRKEGFRTTTTTGSGDYDREGNRRIYGVSAAEGDGESKDRNGEEVGRPSHKLQIYGPPVHMVR